MNFGPVAVREAAGCVLAHSVKLPGGALKKGAVLGAAEMQRLIEAGIHDVVVARLESDDVAEDDAAMQVARALGGADSDIGNAGTGRVNLYARHAGLLMLEPGVVRAAAVMSMVFMALRISSWKPFESLRTWAIALPKVRMALGSCSGPSTTRATSRTSRISGPPTLNMGAILPAADVVH